MEVKKISFCANGFFNEGSFRIPFVWMKYYLSKNYNCLDNKIDKSIDLYFCKTGQGIAPKIRKLFPKANIVLVKPHLEISTNIDLLKPLKSLKSIIDLCLELLLKKQFNKYQYDINASDVLIADSRKLKLYFEASTDKKVIYLRLLEKVKKNKNKLRKKGLSTKKKIVFLFHGGIKHYNESFEELKILLDFISRRKKVDFVCISNLTDIKKKIKLKNVSSKYIPYNYETLIHYLKKADIGYVPNFLKPKSRIIKIIHDYFNFLFYQLNLYSIVEKNSSNAGRAYLFAQFGVPMICHPTREIIADFSEIKFFDFPNNNKESIFLLNKYLFDDNYYEKISFALLQKSKDFDLEKELEIFMRKIQDI